MLKQIHEAEIETPVDLHVHWREENEKTMRSLIAESIAGGADWFAPMPNTKDGLKTAKEVIRYKTLAESFIPPDKKVGILPIVLVNEQTTTEDIDECVDNGIFDCKFYPLGRTTESHNGIRDYYKTLPVAKHCGKRKMRRHLHPEIPMMTIDNRDAEYLFLPILDMFLNETEGDIIWEHGSDARCILTWQKFAKSGRFFVSLTPQHLLTDESDSYGDVLKTFKPSAKDNLSRYSLIRLIEENNDWLYGASDFAPHKIDTKHVSFGRCSCGAYHGRYVFPFYAHALDRLLSTPQGMEIFVNFTSRNARRIYKLPPASGKIKLVRKPLLIPLADQIGPLKVGFFMANQEISWQIAD
jgi:dihydroorotase